jgi:hypothetical protein
MVDVISIELGTFLSGFCSVGWLLMLKAVERMFEVGAIVIFIHHIIFVLCFFSLLRRICFLL